MHAAERNLFFFEKVLKLLLKMQSPAFSLHFRFARESCRGNVIKFNAREGFFSELPTLSKPRQKILCTFLSTEKSFSVLYLNFPDFKKFESFSQKSMGAIHFFLLTRSIHTFLTFASQLINSFVKTA